jgi:hypothetical protein
MPLWSSPTWFPGLTPFSHIQRVAQFQTISVLSRCCLAIALWEMGSDRISFFANCTLPAMWEESLSHQITTLKRLVRTLSFSLGYNFQSVVTRDSWFTCCCGTGFSFRGELSLELWTICYFSLCHLCSFPWFVAVLWAYSWFPMPFLSLFMEYILSFLTLTLLTHCFTWRKPLICQLTLELLPAFSH